MLTIHLLADLSKMRNFSCEERIWYTSSERVLIISNFELFRSEYRSERMKYEIQSNVHKSLLGSTRCLALVNLHVNLLQLFQELVYLLLVSKYNISGKGVSSKTSDLTKTFYP